ncbi:MAG TPA: PAS domain S-box protein [Nitrospiraceae bacterium]|nr:PAS domain S-box protein [Nitrospiraceae bacterium]
MDQSDHTDEMQTEVNRLKSRVAALEQLLQVHEQAVMAQAGRIEAAMAQISVQSDALKAIVTGTASATGEDFFDSLVSSLATALKVRYVLVGELLPGASDRVRTLAVWSNGRLAANWEYDLTGTPCAHLMKQGPCRYDRAVRHLFPHDRLLTEMAAESYCGTPLFDRAGRALGILVVVHDQPLQTSFDVQYMLTIFAARAGAELQRKRAEETLRVSEEQYRLLFENNPHPMWVFDREGLNFLAVNDAAVRHYGYSRDEFLSMTIQDIRPPDSVPRLMAHHKTDLVHEPAASPKRAGIWTHRTKDGTRILVDITWNSIEFGGKRAELVLANDVTDRLRAEEALRASEERHRTVLTSALDGFWIIDTQGRILEVNDAYCRMMGYDRDELLGMTVSDVEAGESAAAIIQHIDVVKAKGGDRFETRHRTKDGAVLDVEVSVRYVHRDGGRFFAFFRDITERKRGDALLRQAGERFLKQESMLLKLTRSEVLRTADREKALRHITEASAQTLGVERVSIWLYSRDRHAIECADLYEAGANVHSSGAELRAEAFPSYFKALATSSIVAAERAAEDERTKEFAEPYLSPLGITSMMDVPIYLFGKLEGVICHEHIGSPRVWTKDEQMFAASIANLISLTYEQEERKRVEDALRESEAKLQGITHAVPGVVYQYRIGADGSQSFPFVSRGIFELFGITAEELVADAGAGWRLVVSEDLGTLTSTIKQSAETLEPWVDEFRVKTPQGDVKWVRGNSLPQRQGNGATVWNGIFTDITEHKRAEEALRASEERFKAFMNNSPAVAFMKDEQGRLIYINEPFINQFSRPAAEWLGKTDWDLWPADIAQQLRANDLAVLAGDKVVELEETVPKLDGTIHQWLMFKFPFVDVTGKKVLAGIGLDITDRKQLEEQLRHSQKMEAVGRLAGGVAHDFNNLLTVMTGYSQLLLGRLGPEDPLRSDVEGISQAGDRAVALTKQLLAFSRRQVVQPKVLDVNVVVANLVDMLQRLIGEDIRLVTRLASSQAYVKFDPGQLEQVLVNLSVNARDAMPEGGTLTIETEQAYEGHGEATVDPTALRGPAVRLVVRDTGCGMDAETRSHLFEPFFTTKALGKGTGLGLPTVYGIISQNGGTIGVESVPGEGTTFTVILPKVEADVPADRATTAPEGRARGTETILVVEDQGMVRKYVSDVLKEHGYHLLEATSGDDALRCSAEYRGRIDLLLTDVVMPRMGGRQLSQQFAATRPDTKVVFMSGYAGDAVLRDEILNGTAFLQKPIAPETLLSKIRELLDTPLERFR